MSMMSAFWSVAVNTRDAGRDTSANQSINQSTAKKIWKENSWHRSRSFKVTQGRWFWYQSKARMRLPISPSPSLWPWSYLALFLRYGDLLAKNCLFFLPLSHSAPPLPVFPLEFRAEVNRQETTVMGLSYSEDPMILAWVVLAWYQRVADSQTNRRNIS